LEEQLWKASSGNLRELTVFNLTRGGRLTREGERNGGRRKEKNLLILPKRSGRARNSPLKKTDILDNEEKAAKRGPSQATSD